ncbi:hypothetical protein [Actinopolymorpha pittospori]|uniref:2,4-dienoyl-CoA reductase-like NADH-dependent reductase (Old Yellow Enzyme family) n=1 Tax=Actinopolymorpha pittospori TaxID=648752 RepID=A0A927RM76_9ACTN|nr:hypothetical protein [Actinopolymorpha pittospori]MBE1608628.1 2,4-dienoyl-CoA reductase-like NADH-dependent reductase (Old Yellow Enzyme family) [Actinopolymorpha pittospori]
MTNVFAPVDVAGRSLANRIVMAPMTRSRAYGPGVTATDLMATYYSQRASAGLNVTEGIQPSPVGQGCPDTPGLHSPEQISAWRKVVRSSDTEVRTKESTGQRSGRKRIFRVSLSNVKRS